MRACVVRIPHARRDECQAPRERAARLTRARQREERAMPDQEHNTTTEDTAAPAPLPSAPAPAAPPVPVASTHPEKWGRVDTDGTVYVTTADGDRAIGSWQAGEPAEGLAHYARRFDDVRTEVELLEARLKAGSGDPKHSLTSAKHVKESMTDAALVGDLDALTARVDHV